MNRLNKNAMLEKQAEWKWLSKFKDDLAKRGVDQFFKREDVQTALAGGAMGLVTGLATGKEGEKTSTALLYALLAGAAGYSVPHVMEYFKSKPGADNRSPVEKQKAMKQLQEGQKHSALGQANQMGYYAGAGAGILESAKKKVARPLYNPDTGVTKTWLNKKDFNTKWSKYYADLQMQLNSAQPGSREAKRLSYILKRSKPPKFVSESEFAQRTKSYGLMDDLRAKGITSPFKRAYKNYFKYEDVLKRVPGGKVLTVTPSTGKQTWSKLPDTFKLVKARNGTSIGTAFKTAFGHNAPLGNLLKRLGGMGVRGGLYATLAAAATTALLGKNDASKPGAATGHVPNYELPGYWASNMVDKTLGGQTIPSKLLGLSYEGKGVFSDD